MTKTIRKLSDYLDFGEFVEEIETENKFDILTTDEDSDIYKVLKAIYKLPRWKQNIIFLYAQLGSYVAVAHRLNLSVGIIWKHINKIKKEIQDDLS